MWPPHLALITHPHKPAFLSVAFGRVHKQMRSGVTAVSLGWLAVWHGESLSGFCLRRADIQRAHIKLSGEKQDRCLQRHLLQMGRWQAVAPVPTVAPIPFYVCLEPHTLNVLLNLWLLLPVASRKFSLMLKSKISSRLSLQVLNYCICLENIWPHLIFLLPFGVFFSLLRFDGSQENFVF